MADRELSVRALGTGVVLGVLLVPCNVYAGLKIGWSFNMSIVALLAGLAFWRAAERAFGAAPWTMKESNIGQTAASSAASIVSGGLVAPIPAWLLLTGERLDAGALAAWVFSVSFLGVWVAWALRPALIVASPLPFPAGIATLETLRDVFAHGRAAAGRIRVLGGAALVSGAAKAVDAFVWTLPRWSPSPGAAKLTFALDPSLLLAGFGAIIGLRTGASLALGALLAWGLVAPRLLASGAVVADAAQPTQFGALVEWLLWPGVSLMVVATLTSLGLRLARGVRRAVRHRAGTLRELARPWALAGFALACALAVVLQVRLFGIDPAMALLAVPFSLLLAVVAARVVGETGIPPIGAIGKVSQLGFGVAAPGEAVTNLMTANVAGGAAGQCADLLNDFRVGHGIGASPARQAVAQCAGILAGSLAGTAVFLALIPDPQAMLLSVQWPAPAVATWKAVAEALAGGFGAVPASARAAMLVAAAAGLVLGVLEGTLGESRLRFVPSATALGLACVIPASISLVMFAGALAAWVFAARAPGLAARFTIAAAAGLVAGESLVGVAAALSDMARG